jgi:hypothetical protein
VPPAAETTDETAELHTGGRERLKAVHANKRTRVSRTKPHVAAHAPAAAPARSDVDLDAPLPPR